MKHFQVAGLEFQEEEKGEFWKNWADNLGGGEWPLPFWLYSATWDPIWWFRLLSFGGKAWTHKLLGRTYVDIYIWWVIRDHHIVVRDSGPPVAAGIQNAEEQSIKL